MYVEVHKRNKTAEEFPLVNGKARNLNVSIVCNEMSKKSTMFYREYW